VSLGLKRSYFDSDLADDTNDNKNDDERAPMDVSHGPEISRHLNRSLVLPGPEPRASVPPLQVSLDEYEGSDLESDQKGHATANETESNVKRSDKRLKEKTKKRKQRFSHISFSLYLQQCITSSLHPVFFFREIEISALEDRALQKDKPQTPDEFEKLVRSSPNSSVVWINYMAFLLDLADVEKARSVAERYV
jgi:rRNA biogenesis protein RRP5